MKDPLGHGSDARGGSGPRPLSAHQIARRAVQQSPNSPPAWAIDALHAAGYRGPDIDRLRVSAGAQVADVPAHQIGIQAATVSKDLTRRMVAPADIERLRNMRDQIAAKKAATR